MATEWQTFGLLSRISPPPHSRFAPAATSGWLDGEIFREGSSLDTGHEAK